MLPEIVGEFRCAAEPNLRFAPSGTAVLNIRAVASSRKKTDSGEWVDDKTCWVNVVAFKKLAENAAESIEKGDLFMVKGRISTDEWENSEGEKRTSFNLIADYIGPSVTFNTAKVSRGERQSSGSGGGGGQQSQQQQADPWVNSGTTDSDAPPF